MKQRILLVDDDAGLREAVAELLRFNGYEVVEASSGNEARRLLEPGPSFDVIVSDHNMPNGGGKDLLEFVRGRKEKPPIFIMITGQATTTPAELARLGAQACLYKPFRVEVLLTTIQKHLSPDVAEGDRV